MCFFDDLFGVGFWVDDSCLVEDLLEFLCGFAPDSLGLGLPQEGLDLGFELLKGYGVLGCACVCG